MTLIRLGSSTHTLNTDQRINRLSFAAASSGGGLDVRIPSNPNETPPGYYMLFILNDQGVPSVSKMINVGDVPVAPLVSVTAGDASAAEAAGDAGRVTVTRSGPTAADLTVALDVRGTARAGEDFDALPAWITIPAGSASTTLTIAPLDDALGEGEETVVLGLANAAGYNRSAPLTATVTIADNEPAVRQAVTSFVLVNADTDEDIGVMTDGMVIDFAEIGTRNLNVRAETSPSVVGSVRFGYDGVTNYRTQNVAPYALGGDDGPDYLPWTPTENAPGAVHTLTTTPFTGTKATGTAGAPLTVTFHVRRQPMVTVTAAAGAVEAGERPGKFVVARPEGSTGTMTVNYEVTGTASAGDDYQSISGLLIFGTGVTSVEAPVYPKDDATAEGDETVTFTATPSFAYNVGPASAATVKILDDDLSTPLPPQAVLAAVADTHVRDGGLASTNYGTSQALEVKKGGSPLDNRQAHVRFDAAGLSTVSRAVLRVYGRMSDTRMSSLVATVRGVADTTWAEGGITWNTRPDSEATVLAQAAVTGTAARWYEFDVTDYVRRQKAAGVSSLSFVLKSATSGAAWAMFNARDAADNRPELVVDA